METLNKLQVLETLANPADLFCWSLLHRVPWEMSVHICRLLFEMRICVPAEILISSFGQCELFSKSTILKIHLHILQKLQSNLC